MRLGHQHYIQTTYRPVSVVHFSITSFHFWLIGLVRSYSKRLRRVSIVVLFLVNQFYGWDPMIEILVTPKKELQ